MSMFRTTKIRILKDTVCAGKDVFAGQVIDAPSEAARLLISMKKAKKIENPKDLKG